MYVAKKGLESASLSEISKFISDRAKRSLIEVKIHFEGVRIYNGVAISPSVLQAFIRYCSNTGTIQKLQPSQRSFRGIGKGTEFQLTCSELLNLKLISSITVSYKIVVLGIHLFK